MVFIYYSPCKQQQQQHKAFTHPTMTTPFSLYLYKNVVSPWKMSRLFGYLFVCADDDAAAATVYVSRALECTIFLWVFGYNVQLRCPPLTTVIAESMFNKLNRWNQQRVQLDKRPYSWWWRRWSHNCWHRRQAELLSCFSSGCPFSLNECTQKTKMCGVVRIVIKRKFCFEVWIVFGRCFE